MNLGLSLFTCSQPAVLAFGKGRSWKKYLPYLPEKSPLSPGNFRDSGRFSDPFQAVLQGCHTRGG